MRPRSGKLRAVFTDRYKALDNKDIVDKMDAYGIEPETEVHLNLDSSLMVVKVPDFSRAFDINADKMVPGIANLSLKGCLPVKSFIQPTC